MKLKHTLAVFMLVFSFAAPATRAETLDDGVDAYLAPDYASARRYCVH